LDCVIPKSHHRVAIPWETDHSLIHGFQFAPRDRAGAQAREEIEMAWHLRKKPSGIKRISKIPTIKPIKPVKPIQAIRPIRPIAPIGHEYYWKPDKK
jgi:hypothetical protein